MRNTFNVQMNFKFEIANFKAAQMLVTAAIIRILHRPKSGLDCTHVWRLVAVKFCVIKNGSGVECFPP